MRRIRSSATLTGIGALLIALAGCGGGGGGTSASSSPPSVPAQTGEPSTGTATNQIPTTTAPAQTTTSPREDKGKTSPEDQPGGGGDETPIATQAEFTGENGTVSPARIRVPPFIAVRVVLRSKDGKAYTLSVAGHELAVGEGRQRASVRLDGLRPGDRYRVRNAFDTPRRLVIVANAEPGP